MSGTSLDGIDLVHVNLSFDGRWSYKIHASECINYPYEWKQKLAQSIDLNSTELDLLNVKYTNHLAQVIRSFIKQNKIANLIAVCSHGHTVSHDPAQGHTLQIGNLPLLASLTNQRIVCDFRIQDVAMGGQGAPLVPIGDRLLFNNYEYCLNIGGFANVSFEQSTGRIAYDICAVNIVLNHYARLLGKEFDAYGAFAKAGTPQPQIIEQLDNLPFYQLQAPKSLGMEWVKEYVFPILNKIIKPEDVLATYTQHIAGVIAYNLPKNASVIVTGGGAFNHYLIDLIDQKRNIPLVVPDDQVINYKEAVIFALLGVLRLRNQNNCLSSVTGAIKDHCSGLIYSP